MLTVLGGLAEFERHPLSRTNEGRVRAKARGVKGLEGSPKLYQASTRGKRLPDLPEAKTLTAIAKSYNVSHMTISRLAGVTLYAIGPDKLCAGNGQHPGVEV